MKCRDRNRLGPRSYLFAFCVRDHGRNRKSDGDRVFYRDSKCDRDCEYVTYDTCFVFPFSSAYNVSVNHSVGLINVAFPADSNPLIWSWTIGNVGIGNAVATFIIQRISTKSCRYLDKLPMYVLLLLFFFFFFSE